LQELDTKEISTTSSVLPPRTMLRDDIPQNGLDTEKALENSASVDANQYKVPPVLD